ncbi:hypothetical protein SAMN04489761_4660 [Tenacibaculum sp. MAR_2009_124]|uniref:hypothetical protein n=1 Tax=Tenacibaculum sp. MAR_2009_124 TaxID=1250059 RepID=UPI0008994D92|nr:hypothetical protein [Tenacibaculum sp. MAR_2009_124]SED21808.1 hypothetical protein SAMN04489761_4660 [Tenacibaculum sp. MAR_2009_124]
MYYQFDIPTSQNQLSGWFDSWCPSNGVADGLENQARNARAEKGQWDKKIEALKKGNRAREWADAKKKIQELETQIEKLILELQKDEGIIDALGIGLGAWCNGAVARRKRAETALRDAERALGQAKGAYNTLTRQQNEGIRMAGQNIVTLKQTIKDLQGKIAAAQQKITVYKTKRDNKAVTESQEDKNVATKGKLMENMPLILGGLAVAGLAIYMVNNKKSKTATKVVA